MKQSSVWGQYLTNGFLCVCLCTYISFHKKTAFFFTINISYQKQLLSWKSNLVYHNLCRNVYHLHHQILKTSHCNGHCCLPFCSLLTFERYRMLRNWQNFLISSIILLRVVERRRIENFLAPLENAWDKLGESLSHVLLDFTFPQKSQSECSIDSQSK